MKSKKLISLLCAAAMSASAFAGLTVTASAATPVYTFDGSDITGFSGNGTLAQVSDDKGEYFSIKANGSSTYSATLTLPADAQLTSADGYTIEYDARLHKSNGMGRYGRYTQVAFIDSSNAAKDSRDYGPYGALFSGGNSSTETGQGYTAGVASSLSARYQLDGTIVNDPGTETLAADNTSVTGIADDMWVRVQTYVKGDVAKVTVIDVNNNKIVDGVDYINSATKLDTIYVTAGRGDDSVTGPGEVWLDNIKIYSGEAETLTTDGLRGVVAAATPIPEPETVSGSAQTLAAPASVTDAYTADFNNATVGTVASIETEDQDAKTVVDGMKVKVGSRSTGADTKTYAAIAKVATGDNALKLAANQFSTNGRGPVVTLDDTKEISSGETAIMGFTTYLSAAKGTDEGGLPRLFLIDNTTNVDGNGCARDILAVITTEDASGYKNGDTPIGIQVTEGWHTVVVAVSEGTYRVFIDGKYKDGEGKLSPAVKGTKVGSGSTSAQVTHLPSFAVENAKSTAYSKALIDNVVAYKITDTLDAKYLPTETAAPTPAPIPAKVTMSVDETANTVTLTSDKDTNAVLVQASYRTDNTLDSVKKVVNLELKANEAKLVPATDLATFTTNDKIMVWDSLKTMTPLANACTVKNGAAQATAKPAPTAEPTEAPTEAPAETPATTDAPTTEPTEAPAETVAPTDTPAPTATAVPTYAVSGTVDAGVKSVTLTEKTDAETPNKYEGTVKTDDKTVTFEKVKAGTYTVSATANSGKEIDTIKLGETEVTEVTVTDADVTTLTVTSKDEAVIPYAEGTITYDGDGDTKVFTELGRVTGTLETTALADNSTKYEKLVANGGKPRAQYVPYAGNYPLKGDAIVANFDYAITGRPEAISLVGKSYSGTEADDNNADTGKLFTISVTTDAGEIEIPKTGNTIDGTNNNSNAIKTGVTGTMNKWYHVETVTNMTDKKIAVKIYAYKANNNYSKETPVYSETLDFRDSTVTGLAGIMINSNSNYGGAAIDNIYFYDQTYITPIKVTATDATVDTTQVLKDDVIKITPKVPSGKKISAVKVNGDPIDAATDGTYKYTVLGTETAIAVTVDFVRADVDNVVVSSTNVNVQKGSSGTYTATVYADAAKKVDITKDSTITWSIAPATEGGVDSLADGTSITNGKLEVADEQSTGKIIITATAVKDITKTDDTTAANQVAGTFEVNIISEPSYQIGVATPANGTVTITVGDNTAATSVKQSESFEIVPKANAGYEIDTVSYRLTTADDEADSYTTVTVDDNGKYTVAGAALSGDITVKVTFKAINYKITNNTVAENGNSIAIRIGDTEAATAIVGQTITIVPTIANGYMLKSISVKNGNTDVTVTNNTFTMPAADVTVEATFEEWNGIYYSQDFESYADTDAVKADWVSASYPAGVTLVTGDTTYGQYLSMDDGTQNGRGVRVTLPASAEVTGQYKVSFDANVKKGNIANRTESSISIGGKDAKTANTNSTFGSGYLFEMVVANDTGIATVSGMTENNTFTPTDATWYHYDLTVDTEAKTVAVVITAKDEAATQLFSGTATINGNGVLKYIQLVGGRAKGKVLMDNIKVTAPWYTDASSGTGTENGTETTPDEGTEA